MLIFNLYFPLLKKQNHIIIFRLSAMGDVAMAIPVLRALIQQNQNTTITFVSKPFLKPLFDNIDRVTFFAADVNNKHKGFLGLFRLYKDLKKLNPTHFADIHNVLRSKLVRFFFSIFSKVSIATIDKGRSEKKALTRKKDKIFNQLKTSHQRYADVFSELGFAIDLKKISALEKEKLNSTNVLLTGEKKNTWIGIAPFAAFKSKTYPIDLLEKVIHALTKKGYHIFLFGGKEDIITLERIQNTSSNTISVAGKLGGLKNEINLISNLDLMLSMDSGNAHFAAMQHIKTVTIWGNTHPYAGFAPFNQPKSFQILPDLEKYPLLPCSIYGNKTFEGYEDVMESITPKKIVETIVGIVEK